MYAPTKLSPMSLVLIAPTLARREDCCGACGDRRNGWARFDVPGLGGYAYAEREGVALSRGLAAARPRAFFTTQTPRGRVRRPLEQAMTEGVVALVTG